MREYGQAPQEGQETRASDTGKVSRCRFKVQGAEFTATLNFGDADQVMEWSEFASLAASASEDINSPAAAGYVAQFFRMVLGQDYSRFKAALRVEPKLPSEKLWEIIADISHDLETGVEEEADRPTPASADSSRGREPTEGRTSTTTFDAQARRLQILSLAAMPDDDKCEVQMVTEGPLPGQKHPPVPNAGSTQRRQQPSRKSRRRSA